MSALRPGRLYSRDWDDPQGHSAGGRIMSMKNSDTMDRTIGLPT